MSQSDPNRRVELIKKKLDGGGLSAQERRELEELNSQVDQEIHKTLGPINEKLSEFAQQHHLDVDFETARALHRVVRAMHDGECPKCHMLFESRHMVKLNGDEECPHCGFTITSEESAAAIAAFAPVMDRNLVIFEDWRANRK